MSKLAEYISSYNVVQKAELLPYHTMGAYKYEAQGLDYKLKGVERTCLVTDALSYAASDVKPDEGSRIIIEDGVCKLADHSSLAGSIATMDVLIRLAVRTLSLSILVTSPLQLVK